MLILLLLAAEMTAVFHGTKLGRITPSRERARRSGSRSLLGPPTVTLAALSFDVAGVNVNQAAGGSTQWRGEQVAYVVGQMGQEWRRSHRSRKPIPIERVAPLHL
jgi:hypothetical protein